MRDQNLVVVENFLRQLERGVSLPSLKCILSEDIEYGLLIKSVIPRRNTLRGLREVSEYLSIMPRIYKILEAEPHSLYSVGDNVIVIGGERAFIASQEQIVKAKWTAVFDFAGGYIKKIIMTVHGWDVVGVKSQAPVLRVA